MAAISSAAAGLVENAFDVAITGGIDRKNRVPTGGWGLVADLTLPANQCENTVLEFDVGVLRKSGHPHKKKDGRYRVKEAELSAGTLRHWIP